jgi:hypothetical protein
MRYQRSSFGWRSIQGMVIGGLVGTYPSNVMEKGYPSSPFPQNSPLRALQRRCLDWHSGLIGQFPLKARQTLLLIGKYKEALERGFRPLCRWRVLSLTLTGKTRLLVIVARCGGMS